MKVGRNEPCPCGSGKKYKQCCLNKDDEAHRFELKVQQEWSRNLFQDNPAEAWYEDWNHEESFEEGDDDDEEDWDDDDFEDEDDGDDDDSEADCDEEAEVRDDKTAVETGAEADDDEEKFWDELIDQDLSVKIALFEKKLQTPNALTPFEASDMLDIIFEAAVKAEAREQYDALLERVRGSAPEVYEYNAPEYVANRITNALALSREENLAELVAEHAAVSTQEPALFMTMLTQLSYYGHADLLRSALNAARTMFKNDEQVEGWLDGIIAPLAVRATVFEFLERQTDEAALFQKLEAFSKIPRARVEHFIALLSGKSQPAWRASDFEIKKWPRAQPNVQPAEDTSTIRDTLGQHVFDLVLQFQGYLRRERGLPYLKSEVGCGELVNYIFQRAYGDVYPQARAFSQASMLTEQYRLCHPEWPPHERLLCPDRVTLDFFCAELLHWDKTGQYKSAALFALLPAWWDFLVAHQLLEPAHGDQALLEVFELHKDLHEALHLFKRDPNLSKNLIGWPWRQTDEKRESA